MCVIGGMGMRGNRAEGRDHGPGGEAVRQHEGDEQWPQVAPVLVVGAQLATRTDESFSESTVSRDDTSHGIEEGRTAADLGAGVPRVPTDDAQAARLGPRYDTVQQCGGVVVGTTDVDHDGLGIGRLDDTLELRKHGAELVGVRRSSARGVQDGARGGESRTQTNDRVSAPLHRDGDNWQG